MTRLRDLHDLLGLWRIRILEETVQRLRLDGEIVGSVHLSNGQEAVAVGACGELRENDAVFATYRGHGWALAKGVPAHGILAELLARRTGVNGGRGGSAHFSAPGFGFYGENSIVGAGVPIAVGAALAGKFDRGGRVCLTVFGDGAMNQGGVSEAMNLSAVKRLPVIFVCENNRYSELTPIEAMVRNPQLGDRAAALGIPAVRVDGNDPAHVATAVGLAVQNATHGLGPTFIEAATQRIVGHYIGDAQQYRRPGELEADLEAEPIARLIRSLRDRGTPPDTLDTVKDQAHQEITAALDRARSDPPATPESARRHLYAPTGTALLPGRELPEREERRARLNYGGAVNAALARCLELFPEAILYGEDVALPGGVFGVTRGLHKVYGERVFDTPISETALLGAAVGAAMLGRRPIVEIMWMDFALVAFDQIVNQAANVRYVSEGRLTAPLTIRTQQGNAPGACAQHSQSLEALLLHVPGIRVAMPATAQDAYDVLLSAVASDDPVVVIENRTLYPGPKAEVRLDGGIQPIGGHRQRRHGDDVTVVTWGAVSHQVREAVDRAGVDADLIEAVWLNPFDLDAVLRSVRRTGRLLVVHEANRTGGFGAEVVARVAESGIALKAPPRRVGARDSRIPAAVALARAVLPQTGEIADALRDLVKQ